MLLTGVAALLVAGGYAFEWTGFVGQTLWDWLELLIVPTVLAAGAFLLDASQRQREMSAESERREAEQLAEEKRRQSEISLADRKSKDEALQAYLDRMGRLILELRPEGPRDNDDSWDLWKVMLRAQTMAVLETLRTDDDRQSLRKKSVARFLHEANLIKKDQRLVEMSGADLSLADLSSISMEGADLAGVNFNQSNLTGSQLSQTRLERAVLSGANLTNADLYKADLTGANLLAAKVDEGRGVILKEAMLREVDLKRARLSGKADMRSAYFSGATLVGADLTGADLRDANFTGAEFTDTILDRTNLTGAIVTSEQLASCHSIKDTAMP